MRITVHDIPPSLNKYLGNSHSFKEYNDDKIMWHWLIKVAIKERPQTPIENARVSIQYHFKDNLRRDPDNYSGKFILDALVKERILKDDSFNNVTLTLSATFKSKEPRTEIIIEPL